MKKWIGFLSLALMVCLPPLRSASAEEWRYLTHQPLFQPLVADPREMRALLTFYSRGNHLDGAIGKTLPLARKTTDRYDVEWGFHAAAFTYLNQRKLSFPMQSSDWWFGTYLSGGRRIQWRLDFTRVSAHLGDALFEDETPIIYSREFLRFLAATRRGPFRFYVGPGGNVHILPHEKKLFLQTGLEWIARPAKGSARLYAAWDFKAKQEAGGVVNNALQAGWQWGDAEQGRIFRIGLTYFNGHSENGQFYKEREKKLTGGIFFDP